MKSFEDRLAVITGAAGGMGRELALQLAAEGTHLSLCDLDTAGLEATAADCGGDVQVSTFTIDVSSAEAMAGFAMGVKAAHQRYALDLLFNNAGIGGAGSFVVDPPPFWERTFDVCWKGVYHGCRAFLPMLMASDDAHIVNTASINGLWASIGTDRAHTAYSAAKFAVRGFTEALVTDLRLHAPHIKASVVMPGHIGTGIVGNSAMIHGLQVDPEVTERANEFRNNAPTSAAQAATVILDGVRAGRWRILVGDDADIVDVAVRDDPEGAYEPEFIERLHAAGALQALVPE